MSRGAHAREGATAVKEDVVGVDAVESSPSGEARKSRLGEDAHAVQAGEQPRPLLGREVERPIDVVVRDPERAEVVDVGADALDRAPWIGLEVRADP